MSSKVFDHFRKQPQRNTNIMEPLNFLSKAETFIVQPEQEHRQTFIFLHGRGDSANTFGSFLLVTPLPDESTLQTKFPNAKFIFLQAPKRTLYGPKFPQWFEVEHLRPGCEEQDAQIHDLRRSIQTVHRALEREIEVVGAGNVVLGGLSQGCASSLAALLLWDGPIFAGCVGMAGWLPFRKLLEDTMQSSTDEGTDNSVPPPRVRKAVSVLAKKLGFQDSFSPSLAFLQMPVYMGHGLEDRVVVPQLGKGAIACMEAMQVKVMSNEYPDLGHWYSSLMLRDIVEFLKTETKWEI